MNCWLYRIMTLHREVRRILSSKVQILSLNKISVHVAWSGKTSSTIPCLQFIVAGRRNRFVVDKSVIGRLEIDDERPVMSLASFTTKIQSKAHFTDPFTSPNSFFC